MGPDKEVKEEHESYGLIRFGRQQGGHNNLFGSSLTHSSRICLTISRGCVYRRLNNDWYSSGDELIEVYMSPAQFAEAITNQNMGVGVPCTLSYVNGVRMADCPERTESQLIKDDFKEKMKEVVAKFDDSIKEINGVLANKKTLTKADRETISNALSRLRMEVGQNVPFVHDQFDEATSKTIHEAKLEIEAFYTHAITLAGKTALGLGIEPPRPALENKSVAPPLIK
jgi:hypothetical protein